MHSRGDQFLENLRSTFRVEAEEHLQAIATGLLALEKSSGADEERGIVDSVFRAAHSLKGAARAVDLGDVESLCQRIEDVFVGWKRSAVRPTREAFDAVHRMLDAIAAKVGTRDAARESPDRGGPPAQPIDDDGGIERPSSAPLVANRIGSSDDTVRIAVGTLDARVLQAEEMLAVKLTAAQRATDLRTLSWSFDAWRKNWTVVETDVRALRQSVEGARPLPPSSHSLARVLEFLDWNLDQQKSLERRVAALTKDAAHDQHATGKLVDDLLEESKKLLLLPFAAITASFPKVVRDLSREQGKEADLVIRGEQVQIDKRILEEMKAPLLHLLRNCIDHGIELPEQRVRAAKPARGTILLAASRIDANMVQILVSDDGAGVDTNRVKASAVGRGILPADKAQTLGAADAAHLIFEPDVSTSPTVTRLSGRGLGLAIVRENVEKLGGSVSVESEPGRGTQFSIAVPSILATFRGILVEAAQQVFVLPTLHVEHVVRVNTNDVQTVEGRESLSVRGRVVALVRLADVLELSDGRRQREPAFEGVAVVLGSGDQRVAFLADAALDEQEVLVKPLRRPLARVRNVAAITVLGSGQIAPILNVNDLLRSAKKQGAGAARRSGHGAPEPVEAKSILVVEDSITSRMLIKGILESAGYRVRTAVDGVEAFGLLRAEHVDLVVSDVEMPRMNGFDLTAKVRADARLAETPVVLVTALETREDRERGIDVGANAYLVKSSFDQSNLLEAVRRLV